MRRRRRSALLLAAACGAVSSASAQTAAPASDRPTLFEQFTFTLAPHREDAVSAVEKAVRAHDELQHQRELAAANETLFGRTLDLLRYLPIHLASSAGDSEDFFTPNYLRPEYPQIPVEPHLFGGLP